MKVSNKRIIVLTFLIIMFLLMPPGYFFFFLIPSVFIAGIVAYVIPSRDNEKENKFLIALPIAFLVILIIIKKIEEITYIY